MIAVFALTMGSSVALGSLRSDPPPAASASPSQPTEPSPEPPATVTGIVSGDTIDTTAGRVRIIGIGAPATGECGFTESAAHAARVAPIGSEVLLAGDGTDRNGLLWRHATTWVGADLGLEQITDGYAAARYDSRDGYKRHLYQDIYIAADAGAPDFSCARGAVPPRDEQAPVAPEMPPLPPPEPSAAPVGTA
jgi:endonuclease YncB( thermonuclease family)